MSQEWTAPRAKRDRSLQESKTAAEKDGMDSAVGTGNAGRRFAMVHMVAAAMVGGILALMGTATFDERDKVPELAPFMSTAQAFSQKLGYALEAKNQPLAEFYLHEIDETFEEIEEKVREHDGVPIAQYVRTMMKPSFEPVRQALRTKQWGAARDSYKALIQSCNSCHAKTRHEYIVILPSTGRPAFSQKF